jgi:F420-0:gamma-glutamyl ligase-like protein
MLKPLTLLGRIESGLEELIAGKTYAFTPVVVEGCCIGLGVAVANEPGYYPVPIGWCHADTWQEMEKHAKELNREMGLDARTACIIVATSMGAGKVLP